MLAQNFKTPADLGIEDVEFDALVKVLGALERGDLKFVNAEARAVGDAFNMGPYLSVESCGTVGCIAGWAHILSGCKAFSWVRVPSLIEIGPDLFELFHVSGVMPEVRVNIQPAQAAIALRNYLTTGRPNWEEALA